MYAIRSYYELPAKAGLVQHQLYLSISIPVWCDWEKRPITLFIGNVAFQFQYGAIGRWQNWNNYQVICPNFNSSMVRLGVSFSLSANLFKLISIPVWCDWENESLVSVLLLLYFNSSMVRLGVIKRLVINRTLSGRHDPAMSRCWTTPAGWVAMYLATDLWFLS